MKLLATLALLLAPLQFIPAEAANCGPTGHSGVNQFIVKACATQKETAHRSQSPGFSSEVWIWIPVCVTREPNSVAVGQSCTSQTSCAPGQSLMQEIRIRPSREVGSFRCFTQPELRRVRAVQRITPALVLRAFRRVSLPRLASIAQPRGKTLVNFETIFHTEARSFVRTVTLLGQRVRLEIRPSGYLWTWGDGSTARTTIPGAPYPDKDVVHRYQHAHVTVQHHVTITWSAQYSVNGGALHPVPGTVTMTGPATALRIAEATPALSGSGH